MRRRLLLLLLPITLLIAGCGGKYRLPTEHPSGKAPASDKSYEMLQTWHDMNGIQDILLTQGPYSQLFLLFNTGGTGGPDTPRGYVRLYPFANPVPVDESYFPRPKTLFSPVALCAGPGRLYVLDQGDSCMAKYDPVLATCEADSTPTTPTTLPRRSQVRDYRSAWRVREYMYDLHAKFTGDTISTFTDTSFAQVYGVAADEQGRVYVSGRASLILPASATDVHVTERNFVPRIFRYVRGPKYVGLQPDSMNWDPHMQGAGNTWHRDTTWAVTGPATGTGYIWDVRRIAWSSWGSPSLFAADSGAAPDAPPRAQTFSPNALSTGIIVLDGNESSPARPFEAPAAVAADLNGYLYVVDRGHLGIDGTRVHSRVVRYDPFGSYVQEVNVEPNSDNPRLPLLDPVTVAADDSVVYVGDRGRNQVIRYKRRP